mgnify:CR=1 FL=1
MKGYLVLEDGSFFEGISFGVEGKRLGEVVFNTGMTGYQEIITDPSYYGQIVCLTYPLIGNCGINDEDFQSHEPKIWGLVVKENCRNPNNWRMKYTLEEYLKEYGVIALEGIDTRSLTQKIRSKGTMLGLIAAGDWDIEELFLEVEKGKIAGEKLVPEVTVREPVFLGREGPRIVILDFGIKRNIVNSLAALGCSLVIVPAYTPPREILDFKPNGVLLSNGPGDPKDALYGAETAAALIGKVPLFGICLGHQLLASALGGDTFKLPFGHRGSNHPVKDTEKGRVYITSQNHGFAVKAVSLPKELKITHYNLNDGTIEGLRHVKHPVFSVQYHPEFSPGPADSFYLFNDFLAML